MKVPEEPILFTKAPNCLVGPYDDVLTPAEPHGRLRSGIGW